MGTNRSNTSAEGDPRLSSPDFKLEVVVLPVSDVEQAKAFYSRLGWRLDADFSFENGVRVVQFTPPRSPSSIQFGARMTTAAPGSAQNTYLVVSDLEAARNYLTTRGVEVGAVFHPGEPGSQFPPDGSGNPATGPADGRQTYSSYARFSDPDGNGWLLQEITRRLPGRVEATAASFATSADLAAALRRAETAHAEHEQRIGARDENWPDWYADFMVAEQTGRPVPD